jgi:solute:Na+ symporter, SSS family
MVIGFIVGLFRMIVDTPPTLSANFQYAHGSFFWIINNINFQYFSILITLISAVVLVAVSLSTPPPDYARIRGLTYETATPEDRARTSASWGWQDLAGSVFVLGMILLAYLYFRG